jgi:Tfp pilus assembly protein PilF
MLARICRKSHIIILALACRSVLPLSVAAQEVTPPVVSRGAGLLGAAGPNAMVGTIDLDVSVQGPDGAVIEGAAVVTVMKLNGQFYRQGTTKKGTVRFDAVAPTEYTIQVIAPGFERVAKNIDAQNQGTAELKVSIQMQPAAEADDAATAARIGALTSRAQKELGKALEALRTSKPEKARSHLDAAYRSAPNHPEVNYYLGIYSSLINDWMQAKSYWTKTIGVYPKHLLALLSLGQALLRENKVNEALPYLNRAVEVEPGSWRAHAVSAEAYLRQGSTEEAVGQAERALELSHGQAVEVQRVLATALAKRGEKDRAVRVLQAYLTAHGNDVEARKQLENLQTLPGAAPSSDGMSTNGEMTAVSAAATSESLPSNWLPPGIDERMPEVEPGVACALDEVIQKAEKRVEEFVGNVDRYTATESLIHESINKWGLASSRETRKFDYVASIEEVQPRFFNFEEYRKSHTSEEEFPDGVATLGLPALALIFHPYHSGNFEMNCEGLARWNGRIAWQVHFRQRPDKPNTIRSYRIGYSSPSHPVALKGRAWIDAESYQIVRLETDMVAPLPEIRLVADRTVIEYGPVHFRERNVDMWLPSSAEVYSDWRGKRFHRRHSFSNYLLFAVDDKQRISAPKSAEETAAKSSSETARQNP